MRPSTDGEGSFLPAASTEQDSHRHRRMDSAEAIRPALSGRRIAPRTLRAGLQLCRSELQLSSTSSTKDLGALGALHAARLPLLSKTAQSHHPHRTPRKLRRIIVHLL